MADLNDRNQEGLETSDEAPKYPEGEKEDRRETGQEPEPMFVRERILNKAESRRKWINRIAVLVVSAVIFGVVSCLVFAGLRPHAEKWFSKEPPETAIHIPKDEETTAAAETEPPETTTEETETEEDIKDVVESAVESYRWSVQDYENLYEAMSQTAAGVNTGIVTVTTRTQETDWFNNTIETEGKASGVIWNVTASEMLVLTSYQVSENETTVEVTFCNGTKVSAFVKAADGKTGIAIVCVPLGSVDEVTKSAVSQVPLGNSFGAKIGQPVILAGSPKDYVGSVAYGMITYVRPSVQKEDAEVRMLYTDVSTSAQATGFVLNLDGQIIGMITSKTVGTNTGAIGISDLKTAIERLSNGVPLAYLGVVGQDVTAEISEKHQVPRGIYVSDAVLEGPAYNVGIQSGDVIVGLDGTEVLTVKELQSYLEGKNPGDTVLVQAQRIGREGYTEIEFPVGLGVR